MLMQGVLILVSHSRRGLIDRMAAHLEGTEDTTAASRHTRLLIALSQGYILDMLNTSISTRANNVCHDQGIQALLLHYILINTSNGESFICLEILSFFIASQQTGCASQNLAPSPCKKQFES